MVVGHEKLIAERYNDEASEMAMVAGKIRVFFFFLDHSFK